MLTEAVEITRTRFGPDQGVTGGALRTAGRFFLTHEDQAPVTINHGVRVLSPGRFA